jgi:uncharacterized protein YdaU (DUF1376 family)
MSKRPWFPLYVGDLLADTMEFSNEEFGAYIRILCHYWVTEEAMTEGEIKSVSRMSRYNFTKSRPLLLKKFTLENGKYFNRRMDIEITKAIELSGKRAKAGSKAHAAIAPANDKQKPTQLPSQLPLPKKEQGPRKKRATQLKSNWILPDDYREYCKTKRPELCPDATAENFLDYYLSVGKPMVDWKRTWQRWVRNERGSAKTNGQEADPNHRHVPIYDPDAAVKVVPGLHPYE